MGCRFLPLLRMRRDEFIKKLRSCSLIEVWNRYNSVLETTYLMKGEKNFAKKQTKQLFHPQLICFYMRLPTTLTKFQTKHLKWLANDFRAKVNFSIFLVISVKPMIRANKAEMLYLLVRLQNLANVKRFYCFFWSFIDSMDNTLVIDTILDCNLHNYFKIQVCPSCIYIME